MNLALKGLPKFTCCPEPRGQHHTTTHLLPDESAVISSITQGFQDVQQGRLPDFPTIEWYFHTPVDPTLQVSHYGHTALTYDGSGQFGPRICTLVNRSTDNRPLGL